MTACTKREKGTGGAADEDSEESSKADGRTNEAVDGDSEGGEVDCRTDGVADEDRKKCGEEDGMRAMKPHEDSAKEVATVYDPAEDYDPTKTTEYKGKRLSLQETRFALAS